VNKEAVVVGIILVVEVIILAVILVGCDALIEYAIPLPYVSMSYTDVNPKCGC